MRHFWFIIITTLVLTHCVSYDFSRKVVQQGNFLSENKIRKLHPGMTKEDVAILMGTSLLSPIFNQNRWDYAYTWRKGTGAMKVKHISIYFKNNIVTQITKS